MHQVMDKIAGRIPAVPMKRSIKAQHRFPTVDTGEEAVEEEGASMVIPPNKQEQALAAQMPAQPQPKQQLKQQPQTNPQQQQSLMNQRQEHLLEDAVVEVVEETDIGDVADAPEPETKPSAADEAVVEVVEDVDAVDASAPEAKPSTADEAVAEVAELIEGENAEQKAIEEVEAIEAIETVEAIEAIEAIEAAEAEAEVEAEAKAKAKETTEVANNKVPVGIETSVEQFMVPHWYRLQAERNLLSSHLQVYSTDLVQEAKECMRTQTSKCNEPYTQLLYGGGKVHLTTTLQNGDPGPSLFYEQLAHGLVNHPMVNMTEDVFDADLIVVVATGSIVDTWGVFEPAKMVVVDDTRVPVSGEPCVMRCNCA